MTAVITYDWEFIDDGYTIDPISVGMVHEDGPTLYAVNRDIREHRIHREDWLMDNVWPSLPTVPCKKGCRCISKGRGHLDYDHPDMRSLKQIKQMVKEFIQPGDQLWAYYAAYDHVCLAQLFGKMKDLPPNIPMHTLDIKQEMVRLGVDSAEMPRQTEGEHNALADAKHNMVMLEFLSMFVNNQPLILPKENF